MSILQTALCGGASLAALCLGFSAYADEAPTEVSKVVVTAHPYAVPQVSSGTRTDLPLVLTPMAIQVVPRDVIEDRAERTALEAVQNVSGVQMSTYEFYDQYLIRGFDSGYGATYRNGLQMRGITNAVDMAFVDHVEVIKGPASMLYGRVEPGGFVNIVTRAPQAAWAGSVSQQLGDWGTSRTEADLTGPVTRDGTLSFRVAGDYDKSDSWVRNAHRDSKAVYGALRWTPDSKFTADLQVEHYDTRSTWLDAAVPVIGERPAHVPRSFTIIDPNSWRDTPYTVNRTLVGLQWYYALSGEWKITQRVHYVRSEENQQGVYADNFDGVSSYQGLRFTHTGPGWVRTSLVANLDLSGEVLTGPVTHKLLLGGDWSRFTDDTPGSTGDIVGAAPLDVFHPVFADYSATVRNLIASDAGNIIWRDRSWDGGIYAQDQMEIGPKWLVLFSGRYDWAADAYADTYGTRDSACYPNCTGFPVTDYPTDTAFSPRAAVLYKLSDAASIYGSYSRSFGAANGRDANGAPLKAQVGEQYELGFKATALNGRVTTTASLFNLTKSNITEYDPVNFFPHIVGEARSRGLELDVLGQVTPSFSLIGSYTYDDATITKDPYTGTEGKRLSGVAKHVASLWAKYDFAPGAVRGLTLGGGVYVSSNRQGDDANTWQMPGYVRIDAMAAYRFPVQGHRLSAQLNINNLFDVSYFDHGGYGMAAYGAPRTVIGSLRLDF